MASDSDPAIKLHVVYERVRGTGLPEDVAVTTHHFTPLSDPWPTDAAHTYTTVETALNTMFAGMKTDAALFGAMTKTKEYRWYRSDDWDQKYGSVVRVAAAGLQPVVPLTEVNQTGGVGGGTIEVPVLGTVEELRIDGVVDIIRRRRFESRGYRLVATPNSPDL